MRLSGGEVVNRSGPLGGGTGLVALEGLVGDTNLFTVPDSVSESDSRNRVSRTEDRGANADEARRAGRIDGADISLTHSKAKIGASMSVSCTSSPRTLNTRTFPACVPIVMSVSIPSYIASPLMMSSLSS
jgi:hypothetical protein